MTENPRSQLRTSISKSRPGSKRSRLSSDSVVVPSMTLTNTMIHPVKEINRISQEIVEGDYDTAISSLKTTLKNIKLILSGDAKIVMPKEPELNESEDETGKPVSMNYCDHKEEDSVPSTTSGAFEYDFYYSSPSSSSFSKTSMPVVGQTKERTVSVFTNPVIVNGDCFEVPLDASLCEELSCVVIYNLALSYHLKGMLLSKSLGHREHAYKNSYLQKALSLYESFHQIFRSRAISVRVPSLHCMALVSNLGQIHHLLGDSTKGQQCDEYMLSVLMYTIDGGQAASIGQHLVEGFLTIVEHLITSEKSTAPAA